MANKRIQPTLNFELLEDVMSLPPAERDQYIGRAKVYRIGPLIEFTYHEHAAAAVRLKPHAASPLVTALTRALALRSVSTSPPNSSLHPLAVEFYRPPQTPEETTDPRWDAFLLRLERAGERAQLNKGFAQALVGTLGEMADNILRHSEGVKTGLVGYRSVEDEFEYIVADAGIGVLNSLRRNVEYQHLVDSGEALETAVADGESRFGRTSGHGLGFSDLLHNIAAKRSYLRFRSGDHCHTIDGTGAVVERRTLSCAPFPGFLISVVCKASKLKKI